MASRVRYKHAHLASPLRDVRLLKPLIALQELRYHEPLLQVLQGDPRCGTEEDS